MKKLLVLAAFVLAPVAGAQELSVLQARSAALFESLNALNASDLSCATAADCGTVGVGSRACGGPAGHVVISLRNRYSVSGTIAQLATLTTEVGQEINRINGTFSICSLAMPPQVACVNAQCAAAQ